MNNLFKENTLIGRVEREKLLKSKGKIIWFTGMSGSGKSTIAKNVEFLLNQNGILTYLLDGDNVRLTLNKDLGFSEKDRKENLRRVGEVANILRDIGIVTLASFVSPKKDMRRALKEKFKEDFIEIYIKCSIESCEKRDVKGLYKKARKEKIENFTGITAIYEEPENPNLIVDTEIETLEESVEKVYGFLKGAIT